MKIILLSFLFQKEIEIMNSAELKEGVSALQSVQELIDDNQEDKEILTKLLEQREALRLGILI